MNKFVLLFVTYLAAASYGQNDETPWPRLMQDWLLRRHTNHSLSKNFNTPQSFGDIETRKGEIQQEPRTSTFLNNKPSNENENYGPEQAVHSLVHRPHKLTIATEVSIKIVPVEVKGILISTELCLDHKLFSTIYDKNFHRITLTQPCLIANDEEHKGHQLLRELSPSQVLPVEASYEPIVDLKERSPSADFQLASSRSDYELTSSIENEKQNYPFKYPYAVTITETKTEFKTRFALSNSIIQKSVRLAELPGVLACMPRGFTLCSAMKKPWPSSNITSTTVKPPISTTTGTPSAVICNSDCGPCTLLNSKSGEFVSSGYPGSYQPYSSCNIRITAPPGKQIEIGFKELHLGTYDLILIYQGDSTTSNIVQIAYNNGNVLAPVQSSVNKNVIELRFSSYQLPTDQIFSFKGYFKVLRTSHKP